VSWDGWDNVNRLVGEEYMSVKYLHALFWLSVHIHIFLQMGLKRSLKPILRQSGLPILSFDAIKL